MMLTVLVTALFTGLFGIEAAFQDYTAAVVEFGRPAFNLTNLTMEDNVNEFVSHIGNARKENVQIIVFPEYALTNGPVQDLYRFAIEVPDEGNQSAYNNILLEKLSDAAKEHSMYVVVNIIELYKAKYYKTDIVFDNTGNIIAKYQAINTGLHSPGITPGPVNQPKSVFETDFGRFGLIGSYDIPANISNIPRLANVTDLILTTSRSSSLPFGNTLSMQLGFAMANKVNLLAASLSRPDEGIGGSGIYGADGVVYEMFINARPMMKLLFHTVSRMPVVVPYNPFTQQSLGAARPDSVPEITKFSAARRFSDKLYTTALANLSNPYIKSQVCHGKFCCNFELNVTASTYSNDHYRFLAFRGSDLYGERKQTLKICGVVACETDDVSTCATRNVTNNVRFDGISVQYQEDVLAEIWSQPVLLSKDLIPVTNSSFDVKFDEHGKKSLILSTKEQANVVVFGIMASGVETLGFSLILTVIMSSVSILFR